MRINIPRTKARKMALLRRGDLLYNGKYRLYYNRDIQSYVRYRINSPEIFDTLSEVEVEKIVSNYTTRYQK